MSPRAKADFQPERRMIEINSSVNNQMDICCVKRPTHLEYQKHGKDGERKKPDPDFKD